MKSLSASELIAVWERGVGQHPVDRALTLLSACYGEPREQLALAAIGKRDELLLRAYRYLFGDALQAFAECPQCGQGLEYSLSAREIGARSIPPPEPGLSVTEGAMQIRLRLPNSLDLGAAAVCADPAAARRLLAERCVVEAIRDGQPAPAREIPESAVARIAACLAEADPQAEILIDLACAGCHHAWQVVLETESFLWMKISALARRLLREVHTLAEVYGWSEHDILALSPLRRQAYMDMVS